MTAALCHECIEDKYLSAELHANGERIECSECGKKRKGITVDDLGKLLEPLLREYYVPGEEYRVFDGEDDDRGHFAQQGEELTDIIQSVMGTLHSCHDEIVSAVMDADHYWPPDGEQAYWEDFACYVFNNVRSDPTHFPDWYGTQAELKHGRRFFSPAAQQLFGRLFAEIDELRCWENGDVFPVVYELPSGTQLFRARVTTSQSTLDQVCDDPGLRVGPPPPEQARSSRMNPDGVSVVYAATDEATCIAEMRPAIGSDVAIISLITTRGLRVLDFNRLESALGEHSFFDPEFSIKLEHHRFLKRLHGLISRPVVPGKEADYLITQTMAEYLSHVHAVPLDGILFKSAQREGGINVVLFSRCGDLETSVDEKFGVKYEEKSLKLVRISKVEIFHKEMAYHIGKDGKVNVFDPNQHYD